MPVDSCNIKQGKDKYLGEMEIGEWGFIPNCNYVVYRTSKGNYEVVNMSHAFSISEEFKSWSSYRYIPIKVNLEVEKI